MSIQKIYNSYMSSGYSAVKNILTVTGDELFYLALLAFSENKLSDAFQYACRAKKLEPDNCAYQYGVLYLERLIKLGKSNVYIDDGGFNAFINGGSNIELYEHTSNALKKIYLEYKDKITIFDIGVGDGKALLPAITKNISHIDLLEPSEIMLKRLCTKLDNDYKQQPYNVTCSTFQNLEKNCSKKWDIIQGTYSMHSFPYEERKSILKWIRNHCKRIIITEFDVPEFSTILAPDYYRHIIKRYNKGLSEYTVDRELVALGFLMPVMFGYFDKSANRTTYEQPIQTWVDSLKECGFREVRIRQLYPYWWANAYIIDGV